MYVLFATNAGEEMAAYFWPANATMYPVETWKIHNELQEIRSALCTTYDKYFYWITWLQIVLRLAVKATDLPISIQITEVFLSKASIYNKKIKEHGYSLTP